MNLELRKEQFARAIATANPDAVRAAGDALWRSSFSLKAFCELFFKEYFPLPWSPMHEEYFDALDNDDIEKLVAIGARDLGKSTILKCWIVQRAIFKKSNYIVYVQYAADKAEQHCDEIATMLLRNRVINAIWPAGFRSKELWSKEKGYVLTNGVRIEPRGTGQQLRGSNFRGNRPDLFVLDDFDDEKEMANDAIRAANEHWLHNTVEKAVDSAKPWRIVLADTLKHYDSTAARQLKNKSYRSLKMPICGSDLISRWPEKISTDQLIDEYETAVARGNVAGFLRERRCELVAEDQASFKAEQFKPYSETAADFIKQRRALINAVLVDPAKTLNDRSCKTGIVGVGVNAEAAAIYVRDVELGIFMPDDTIDRTINMAVRLGARIIGLEVNSLHTYITQPFENEIRRRGLGIQIIELKAVGKKNQRAAGLIPYYRQGRVFHNDACCRELEQQLSAYPMQSESDLIDPLAYIVDLMNENVMFWHPSREDDAGDGEEEFAELADTDGDFGSLKNWRVA